jgi:hypothetical protein
MKVLKLIAGGIGVCLLIVAAKLAIDAGIIQPWIVAQADMAMEDERAFESIVAFWRNKFPERIAQAALSGLRLSQIELADMA